MNDAKNNVEDNVEGNFYFYVKTKCIDGSHEYTDSFLVSSAENLNAHDEKWEQYEELILDWNYHHCEWNDHMKSHWDGQRLISVVVIQPMTYEDFVVVNGYLSCLDFDELSEGCDEEKVYE